MDEPTEIDLAEQLAQGAISAPVALGAGSWLVRLRVSGTGVAHRPAHAEYVFRAADIWLSPEMVRRCAGLLVVLDHPVGGLLDGLDDLRARFVGVLVLAYVRGDELWGVARLFDEETAQAVAAGAVDTSPAVTFAPGNAFPVTLSDGAVLIVEGVPLLVDHLALVSAGVWSRGSPPGENSNNVKEVELINA